MLAYWRVSALPEGRLALEWSRDMVSLSLGGARLDFQSEKNKLMQNVTPSPNRRTPLLNFSVLMGTGVSIRHAPRVIRMSTWGLTPPGARLNEELEFYRDMDLDRRPTPRELRWWGGGRRRRDEGGSPKSLFPVNSLFIISWSLFIVGRNWRKVKRKYSSQHTSLSFSFLI